MTCVLYVYVQASDSKKAKDSTTKPAKQSYTDDQFSKLIKVVRKRLKKKGKVRARRCTHVLAPLHGLG